MKMLAAYILVLALVLPSQAALELSSGATGYEYFPGFGFYKFHSEAQTWSDAVETCIAEGGQLGFISFPDEAQVYSTIVSRPRKIVGATNNNYFFVGLREFQNSREFLNLQGVPLTDIRYSQWAAGEPNNYEGRAERCGTINNRSELNDYACSYKLAFICELKYNYIDP